MFDVEYFKGAPSECGKFRTVFTPCKLSDIFSEFLRDLRFRIVTDERTIRFENGEDIACAPGELCGGGFDRRSG